MRFKVCSQRKQVGITQVFLGINFKALQRANVAVCRQSLPGGLLCLLEALWCLKLTVTCEMMVFILSLVTEM